MHILQRSFSPLMEAILQNFNKFAISESVHNFAQLFAADPREDEDVHPNFGWNVTQCKLHSIVRNLNLLIKK